MFFLHEELPESIVVDGIEYRLDMSFDNVLRMYEMMNDKELTEEEQVFLCINMLFIDIPKLPLKELYKVWKITFETYFAEEIEKPILDIKGNPMPVKDGKKQKFMDIKQDAKYIYSSFMKDYKIDLFEQQGKLHWYKFKSLLDGLSDDTRLKNVIKIRQMELPKGKGSEKSRKEVLEAKKYYELKGDEEDGS